MTTLFIGLGRMGQPMVRNYWGSGRAVVVQDANPDVLARMAGELASPTLSEIDDLSGIDTVILMLPSSPVVESVLEGDSGLLGRLSADSLIIDMSSSVPASTQRLAAISHEKGIAYVDAPVSGGVAKAIKAELSIIVGGNDDGIRRALPHLQTMGGLITHVGGPGAGHAAKALNNLLSATNIAATAEILSVATRFGIDPRLMTAAINASTGRSQASEVKFTKHILPGTYDSGFAFSLMVKDIGIATDLASEFGVPLHITGETARAAIEAAQDIVPEDHSELARYIAERSGTSLERPVTAHEIKVKK